MLEKFAPYEQAIKYALFLFLVAALLLAGWVSRGWYEAASDLRVEQAIDKAVAKASSDTGKQIAGITVQNTTIQGKVIERIVTEKVYAECKHDPITYQLLQEALK